MSPCGLPQQKASNFHTKQLEWVPTVREEPQKNWPAFNSVGLPKAACRSDKKHVRISPCKHHEEGIYLVYTNPKQKNDGPVVLMCFFPGRFGYFADI